MRIVSGDIVQTPIDVAGLATAASDDAAGAVVSFAGVVRDHDAGRPVTALDYSAHPSAAVELGRILADFAARHPEVLTVAVQHRVGPLRVGDIALGAAVGTAHRQEGFAAIADLVDAVKAGLPIWKHQHFGDGHSEWSNLP